MIPISKYTKFIAPFLLLIIACSGTDPKSGDTWIRINQLGYFPQSVKIAVLGSKDSIGCTEFSLSDAATGKPVWTSETIRSAGAWGPFKSTYRLDFSSFQQPGCYTLKAATAQSPPFRIAADVYDGTADFLLRYMRQQRCGFNPFLRDSCHTHDGYTIYGPMPDGTHIDVTGGWHDAGDYLQYAATSANATFHLLFAWREFPTAFTDSFDASGLPGSNGLPDVLDEARWGLDWLLKMHPRPDWMFNQIADDRDHRGWRLPTEDTTSYGRGRERPVYFCSGEAQGLMAYKNRSTGVASTAGKFASAFALGAEIFETLDPDYADLLRKRALSAWRFGLKKPGVCQTAPCRAPYFYEEDNWVDDVELAAAELYALTKNPMHLEYGRSSSISEPITPWMGADTARHYQWYPFMNIGHFELARIAPAGLSDSLIAFYREGIERVWQRGKDNPFLMGVPFIWCSNNLVTALATQCYLYRSLTGDDRYLSLEAAMRDWLFGCNPWGVSMVINLPQNGVTAHDPHSAFSNLYNYPVDGGLLDGPVYGSIYNKLKYVHLKDPDEFAAFQSELVVYHDDVGDYATNEPTMDGTATLITYLAAIQQSVQQRKAATNSAFTYAHGGIIRGDQSKREITLVFTGDEHADGSEPIRQVLARAGIKAAFFFTGNFYRNPEFADLVRGLRADGHYLGAHSDKHLLYCDWQKRDNLLVTHEQFEADLKQNYVEMARFGITRQDAPFFLPPYEWCNRTISEWCRDMELTLINFTPGTRSNADYTTPDMGGRYISSAEILKSILEYEQRHANGLNGFILLSHIGTHPSRTDKFYLKLGELIDELRARGYGFRRVDEMLDSASSAWRLADA